MAMATAKYDGVVYEMEHNPWDIRALKDSLQYMLNRGQIAKSGSVAPGVTPDGAHPAERRGEGPVPGQAGARFRGLRHRLAAHQHRRRGAQRGRGLPLSAHEDPPPLYEPAGIRGDGPTSAVRYWG